MCVDVGVVIACSPISAHCGGPLRKVRFLISRQERRGQKLDRITVKKRFNFLMCADKGYIYCNSC